MEEGNFTFDGKIPQNTNDLLYLLKKDNDWKNISQEAKNLITKMLQKDPKKRISAKECYEDAWI